MAATADQRDWLSTVWGETAGLASRDGSPAALNRLAAVVGKLSQVAYDGGTGRRLASRAPPRREAPEEPAYDAIKDVAVAAVEERWRGPVALPAMAVLWEVSAIGMPRTDRLPIPEEAQWILRMDAATGGDFVDPSGRMFRLFESQDIPKAGQLPFISGFTGSGAVPLPSRHGKLAWSLGIIGIALFVAGMMLATFCGRTVSNAYGLLAANDPAIQKNVLAEVKKVCDRDKEELPALASTNPACNAIIAESPDKLSNDKAAATAVIKAMSECRTTPTGEGCAAIWRAAASTNTGAFGSGTIVATLNSASRWLTGTDGTEGTASVAVPLVIGWAGIALLVLALGVGTKGMAFGVWIDGRNRVSLARAQVTVWTIVALGGYAVFASFNVGMFGTTFRAFLGGGTGVAAPDIFPSIPSSIAAALGISAASLGLSSIILATKPAAPDVQIRSDDPKSSGLTLFGTRSSGLDVRASPHDASLADIFMGEEDANSDLVDLSRLQNVLITVLLALGYGSFLLDVVRDIAPVRILQAFANSKTLLPQLPDPGGTFAGLLLASHAAYLMAKSVDKKSDKGSSAVPK